MKLDDITYTINGCAIKVHKTLGNGFQEVIYQRCLEIELKKADFIVENQVVVELKAIIKLEDVHLAQAKNYVVAYNFPVGLLINFGALSLEYKKIFNPRYRV